MLDFVCDHVTASLICWVLWSCDRQCDFKDVLYIRVCVNSLSARGVFTFWYKGQILKYTCNVDRMV